MSIEKCREDNYEELLRRIKELEKEVERLRGELEESRVRRPSKWIED